LEKGRVATTPFSVPVQVLINTSRVLEGTKNERCKCNAMIEYVTIRKLKG